VTGFIPQKVFTMLLIMAAKKADPFLKFACHASASSFAKMSRFEARSTSQQS
jgi:hypothetical protein